MHFTIGVDIAKELNYATIIDNSFNQIIEPFKNSQLKVQLHGLLNLTFSEYPKFLQMYILILYCIYFENVLSK